MSKGTSLQQVFSDAEAYLKSRLVARDQAVRGLMTALVAKQHVVLLGPPGTAKSLLATEFFGVLSGARTYSYLMTKTTVPEEIFGPVSLAALKADRYERKTAGYAADVEGLFLDEIFKANSAILNALLTLLNERYYDNGGARVKAPLTICVGASNELPEDDSLQALWDRFTVRYWLRYVDGQDAFDRMLDTQPTGQPPAISKTDLAQAQAEAAVHVTFGQPMKQLLWDLKSALTAQNVPVSDRTWRKSIELVKASAWLRGVSAAQPEDAEILADGLWNDPAQAPVVTQAVMKLANPDVERAQRVLDTAVEAFKSFPFEDLKAKPAETLGEAGRLNREMKKAVGELATLSKSSSRIAAMHGEAVQWHQQMSRAVQEATGA